MEVDASTSIVIEQKVVGDGVDTAWHTRVAEGAMSVIPGPAPESDITLTCDPDTAASIASGRLSAQRAFLDGRLRLDGDVRSLMAARPALDALADVFAGVRNRTTDLH